MKAFYLIALLLPFTAEAINCTSLKTLEKPNGSCSDNGAYLTAGVECLEALEALINAKTGVLSAAMSASNQAYTNDKVNKQTNTFAGTTQDYNMMISTIDSLIKSAKVAKGQVAKYQKSLFYPEEWDAPKEVIGDPDTFFDSHQCYAEPRDALSRVQEELDVHIEDLENAKKAAAQLRANSQGRESKLDEAAGSEGAVANTSGDGGGKKQGASGKSPKGESGVSGQEEDRKKRQETKKILNQ